jgi:beta-lactamase class D
MRYSLFSRLVFCLLSIFSCLNTLSAEENFILINGTTEEIVLEIGSQIDERMTPCSTFKIALSLMGYDSGILADEKNPTWFFQEGYDDYLESWKDPQSPQSWIKNSCLWYSKVLAIQLGLENIQDYLISLEYGNQDMSGGLTIAWVNSSLKISPREQVDFIRKIIHEDLALSGDAVQKTKKLLFADNLSGGWKLYGKTGWSGLQTDTNSEIGWFIGWIEKDNIYFPFAYNILGKKMDLSQRIPRVKELLIESKIISD